MCRCLNLPDGDGEPLYGSIEPCRDAAYLGFPVAQEYAPVNFYLVQLLFSDRNALPVGKVQDIGPEPYAELPVGGVCIIIPDEPGSKVDFRPVGRYLIRQPAPRGCHIVISSFHRRAVSFCIPVKDIFPFRPGKLFCHALDLAEIILIILHNFERRHVDLLIGYIELHKALEVDIAVGKAVLLPGEVVTVRIYKHLPALCSRCIMLALAYHFLDDLELLFRPHERVPGMSHQLFLLKHVQIGEDDALFQLDILFQQVEEGAEAEGFCFLQFIGELAEMVDWLLKEEKIGMIFDCIRRGETLCVGPVGKLGFGAYLGVEVAPGLVRTHHRDPELRFLFLQVQVFLPGHFDALIDCIGLARGTPCEEQDEKNNINH